MWLDDRGKRHGIANIIDMLLYLKKYLCVIVSDYHGLLYPVLLVVNIIYILNYTQYTS